MGTIMTACMAIGLLFATRLPVVRELQKLPVFLTKIVAVVVFLAGSWNIFWYALQHLNEFWGVAALVSGVLMLLTAAYIFNSKLLPRVLQQVRPVVLFLLLCCSVIYGVAIYQL